MKAFQMIYRVTRAYLLAGIGGGFVLGAALPLLLLPLMLLGIPFGYEAEFSTVLLIAAVGAMTGAIVGLAVGLIVGILASLLTLLVFRSRTGTAAHRHMLRLLTVPTAAALIFFGVGLLTGSTDMSATTVLIWRVPSALIAAGFGWWLAGRMAHNEAWQPEAMAVPLLGTPWA